VRNALYTFSEDGKIQVLDFVGTAKRVQDAVVNVRSMQKVAVSSSDQLPPPFDDFFKFYFGPDEGRKLPPQTRTGIGSGVVVDVNGYIVTNNHVVAGADTIEVTLTNNKTYKAKVIGVDPSTDIALIKIDEKHLPVLPFVNSDSVEVGEWVLAIGNPYELNSTVTAGIISAKDRFINILPDQNAIQSFIQTDAAINPGNSGGALVNLQGGLVGINTAIASPTGSFSGYGFAIPSNIVSKIVKDFIQFGKVQRGFLGVSIININSDFAKSRKIDIYQGAYVDSIVANGAADKAGIKKGDVITAIEGHNIRNSSQLQEYVAMHHPGDKINITINRKEKVMNFTTTLQDFKAEDKNKKK
jgi:Do/DeqQ family serine protease